MCRACRSTRGILDSFVAWCTGNPDLDKSMRGMPSVTLRGRVGAPKLQHPPAGPPPRRGPRLARPLSPWPAGCT
eukprot:1428056-Alexandrium_andersonii.AAC.1